MVHENKKTRRIAIIGNAFRFPSTDRQHFWQDLIDGKDLVSEVAADRWAQSAFFNPDRRSPGSAYTFAAGSVGDVSHFDAGFFGISPREAAQMDPQQRLLLEMAWETLEDAGIPPSSMRGSQCGVFIGLASADYSYRLADDLAAIDASTATGNTASVAANRISYFFDWHGPSMVIDTACSSSLVAFHQACRAVISGEVPCAITGGISLHLHPYGFIIFSKASMLSPSGRCNTFDADGDGYVRSEGGGLFLLKDFDQAIADGNNILAVVAHSAVNTDGRKSGITVPNPAAQAALLRKAYADAGIMAAEIDYLEAHGTGTAVGDPLETAALGEALGTQRPLDSPLPIGSIKSNLGHLETASGVAGLAKALYALRHRVVPATRGIKTLNPKIRTREWNLEVVTENRPLKPKGRLIIGINSFGFGGANAHVILESHETSVRKETPSDPADGRLVPLIISGRSPEALRANAQALAESLQRSHHRFYDLSWQLRFGRELFEHRAVLLSSDLLGVAESLTRFAAGESPNNLHSGTAIANAVGPVFVYSGNGSQWFGMGKALLADTSFLAMLREVDQHFCDMADFSLEAELRRDEDENRLAQTEIAQPCLFAVQLGITAMLRAQGVAPKAVCGHSVGEVAAAWACGALSLPDAVRVIFHRSRLQGQTRGSGQMSAVGLGAALTQKLIDDLELQHTCIAGINSNKAVTIAGDCAELAQIEAVLHEQTVFYKRLPLDYAFHSPAMDGIEADVIDALKDLAPKSFRLPYYSTVSGSLLGGDSLDAGYWWHNIRQPVAFEAAVSAMIEDGFNVFIEIGPQPVLRSYINDCLKNASIPGAIIATGKNKDDGPTRILAACADHIIAGGESDWSSLFPGAGQHSELPTYAWQRERHWHTPSGESLGLLEKRIVHPLLGHPVRQHPNQWENVLDPVLQPMLADHVVGEAVVFPGAGYVELALAVAREKFGRTHIEIEALEISAPLLFGSGKARKLRVTLDESDGSLAILAREYAGHEGWVKHAVARLLAEPGLRLHRRAIWPGTPARAPDFSQGEQQALHQSLGLSYGPAFRSVECGWINQREVLACLRVPHAISADFDDYLLHPGVLDGCFQLIAPLLHDQASQSFGLAFIPVRIGRIAMQAGGMPAHFAQARLRLLSPYSLLADFALFDAQGRPIAILEDVRFRAVRLLSSQTERVTELSDSLIAAPLPRMHSLISNEKIAAALKQLTEGEPHSAYTDEVSPLLDALYESGLRETLSWMLASNPDGLLSLQKELTASRDNRLPVLNALVTCMQRIALLDPNIQPTTDTDESFTPSTEIWQLLLHDYPDHFPLFHSIGHIQHQLRHLLSSSQGSPPHLPAGFSSATLVRNILGVSKQAQIAAAVRTQILTTLAALRPGERLRILEVACEEPLFASQLCPSLPADRGDYCFASLQPNVATGVAELASQFPVLSSQQIGPAEQSSAAQSFDFALLALEGISIAQANELVRFARGKLLSGGSLLVIASPADEWLRGSLLLSGQEPLANAEQVQQAVIQAGFSLTATASTNGCTLLLAKTTAAGGVPLSSTARRWLILSDSSERVTALSELVAEAFNSQGDQALICEDADASAVALRDLSRPFDGILMLAGLGVSSNDALSTSTQRCMLAAHVVRICEGLASAPPLLLVTQGVLSQLLPESIRSHSSGPTADAAFWGFGRSLANEERHQQIRLIDISSTDATKIAQQLARALNDDCTESEVLLGPQGERFATRISLLCPPQESPGEQLWKLGFSLPGQLRNLAWQAFSLPELQTGEVDVKVEATGLNFRDVMYTLGLLSDEALESGFAGATLGLEFSGTVVRSQNDDFASGDRVVGFSSASFANRVITHSRTIARIPAGLSFEAAATIPTTFFTAYYALHHLAQLQEGERVLIHGGAGGVGIAAIQIARKLGATIFATAGSDEKRDFLRLLGVENVFDSRSLSYAEDVLLATAGEGVDVVLNSLAGEAINRNFQVLKPFGRFLELGKRDFYENTQVGLRPFRNNLSYFGIDADQLMRERPELTQRLFKEVMDLFAQGELHPLPWQAFEANRVVEAFRHMQQARQIGKIVVTYREGIHGSTLRVKSANRLELSASASYLVTGGLAGFGLRSAEWLVERGARHLILLSRSGPQHDEAQAALARLAAQGVKVIAVACDVTDGEALAQVLQEASYGLPPLRGIIHAAAVIEDALIQNLDTAQLERVLAPKILGAQNLHMLTRDLALDFFVLYSSATTLFGNPGQAAYVAANTWLEALARHRRAQGLPATCMLWGAIDDVGFLARNERVKETLHNRMGGNALRSATALDILESTLLDNNSGSGILELDWHTLGRFLPTASTSRYQNLRRVFGEAAQGDDGGRNIRRLLAELGDEELTNTVSAMLCHELGEILRIEPDKIATDRSIQDLGMDSLMGVELVIALEDRFGVRLPVLALSESPTIDRLAERLIAQLREQEDGQAHTTGEASLSSQVRQLAASHASEGSVETIAELTRQLDTQITTEKQIHS